MDIEMPKYIMRPDVNYYGPDDMHLTARFSPFDAVFDGSGISRKKLDVNYGPLPEQLMDIYYPEEGDGPFPTVFFVHGGAFIGGDRHSGSAKIISSCLKHGYVLISVEYRLAPMTKFPEFLYDIKTAVRYARANAKELSLRPDQFAMAGDSAGGYLSAMTAATAGIPAFEGEKYGNPGISSELQAVAAYFGCHDVSRDFGDYYAESGVKCLPLKVEGQPSFEQLAFNNESAPNLAPLCCPFNYITKSFPPAIILHGISDAIVPYQHSVILADKIKEVCGEDRAELHLYEERNHEDIDFLCEESSDLCVEFLDRVFGRK